MRTSRGEGRGGIEETGEKKRKINYRTRGEESEFK